MRVADVTDCLGSTGFQSLDASSVKETGFGSLGLVVWFDPFSKISIICLIGVIPAIGSLEKGKLNAIAPTSRLSMYTGEPDIPPNTPVFATFGPVSRAIIADCRAPGKPGNTPRISIPNSSGSVPEKTVRAVPFIPGRTSSRGNRWASLTLMPAAGVCAKPGTLNVANATAHNRSLANCFIISNLIVITSTRGHCDYNFRFQGGQGNASHGFSTDSVRRMRPPR